MWVDLFDGELSAGEFRLQQTRTNWVLHVTVEYEIEPAEMPDDPTPVGFDIGESKLLTGCALTENGTPKVPFIFNGGRARQLRKEMHTTLKRLQERDCSEWRRDERFDHYQNALTDIVEKASRQAVEYAQQFDDPVIVLEDLSYIRENLDYGSYMNRRLHGWAFARLTERIEDKSADAGIPVRFVNPAYTSKTCHACDHIGRRGSQAEFRCTNSECWVTEYQADINAAANIAGRLDPWEESLPWKPAGDDSPQDRSGCDTATGHHSPSPKSGQTTLVAFQS
jgi:IS605 OrfB family transposase